jgi:hypothetical protein
VTFSGPAGSVEAGRSVIVSRGAGGRVQVSARDDGSFLLHTYVAEGDELEFVVSGHRASPEARATRATTPDRAGLPFVVETGRTSGTSPLHAVFRVHQTSRSPILEVELDAEGTGDFVSVTDRDWGRIDHTYTGHGKRVAVLRIVDDSGFEHLHEVPITLTDPGDIDGAVRATWDAMNAALVAGDKRRALTFVSPWSREQYSAVFDALMPQMRTIVSEYSELRRVSLAEGYAEFAIARTVDGTQRVFMVTFVQDEHGRWLMDSM